MAPRILLVSSFSFPGKRQAHMELPEGMRTIGDLLRHLGQALEYSLLAPGGRDIDDDLEVSINGRGLWSHAQGLDTVLRQDDVVEIYMLTLGGG
ncbi:MAG: hypothetical protein V1806_05630 [Pseudomonadota bacterium]